MARLISLVVLILLMIFLGLTFYQVVAPFLLPLFMAGVVAIIFQPVYRRFLEWTKDRIGLSAGLTTGTAVLALLVPLALGIFLATGELLAVAEQIRTSKELNHIIETVQSERVVQDLVHKLQPVFGERLDEEVIAREIRNGMHDLIADVVRKTLGMAGGAALTFLGHVFSVLVSAGMFLIALFYFLYDGTRLIAASEKMIPVQIVHQRQLARQFESAVRAVVVSTFFAAIAQGVFTTVVLYFLGFERFFLLLFLTTFASMIPLAGAWLVWLPCAGWLLYTGYWGQALFLTLYGAFAIGMLDNFVRTYVLNTNVKLHPLLAFISVLGGVQVMGLWGVFVAPIVASCLHALVQIFNTELRDLSKVKFEPLRKTFSRKKKPQEPAADKKQPEKDDDATPAPEEVTADSPESSPKADGDPDPKESPPDQAAPKSRGRSGRKR